MLDSKYGANATAIQCIANVLTIAFVRHHIYVTVVKLMQIRSLGTFAIDVLSMC